MKNLTDIEIIEELNNRFSEKNRLLVEQKQFMTDLKTVNDKLIKSELLKSHFLSNIKNEVNNPMTSILGLLKLNLSSTLTDHQKLVNMKLIYKEANWLNFQLQNVFAAAEIEAGECNLTLTSFSYGELINRSVATVSELFGKPEIKTRVNVDLDEKVTTDRDKLSIVLLNIISNAYKFGAEDNTIEISAVGDDQNQIVITIQDHGVGIDQTDMALVFDRFNQLETGTTKSFNGHGLGLSIAHAFLDMMDGVIRIHSVRNEGTRVELTLPVKNNSIYAQVFDEEDNALFFINEENEQLF